MSVKSILIALGVLSVSLLHAQEKQDGSWYLHASYYALNVSKPGLKLGAEKHFIQKQKEKKGNGKLKWQHAYYGFNVGYYYIPKLNSDFFLEACIGYRRYGTKDFIHGLEFGIMGIKSFNYGTTYMVTESNEVEKVRLASNNYIAPKFTYEFGYCITDKLSVSIKPGMFIQTMHFKSSVNQFTTEITVNYKL